MIDIKNERNLTMLTDFYELTMANGYLHKGMQDRQVVFAMFFRRIPDGGGDVYKRQMYNNIILRHNEAENISLLIIVAKHQLCSL